MNMKFKFPGAALGVTLGLGAMLGAAAPAAGQMDHMAMMSHAPDTRKLLDFPAPMREHMLSNMRGHLQALNEILAALSIGDGPKAAKIAKTRLGVESPGAAACVPNSGTTDHSTHDMAAMMAQFMPEDMRALGLAMHESASEFAREAAKTQAGGDLKPALASLARVTQSCAACHAEYRLK
ncbi:MAG TPA: hypothetical protein VIE47_05070 [Methylocystis sp.]